MDKPTFDPAERRVRAEEDVMVEHEGPITRDTMRKTYLTTVRVLRRRIVDADGIPGKWSDLVIDIREKTFFKNTGTWVYTTNGLYYTPEQTEQLMEVLAKIKKEFFTNGSGTRANRS